MLQAQNQTERISIHALREEGDPGTVNLVYGGLISIHALREEGDAVPDAPKGHRRISIHALREEGDLCKLPPRKRSSQFLSTPSARRATQERGGKAGCKDISIHALREEGDVKLKP